MDLTPHIDRLVADIAAAAALGDDETKRVVAALSRPTESAARLMLIGALSEFAREVEESTGTGVGISIEGDHVNPDPRGRGDREEQQEEDERIPSFEEMTGDISRVTLRLVEQMKSRAEEAAAQNGISLNSWVAQAVQGALRDHTRSKDKYREYGDKYWKAGRTYFDDLKPDDFVDPTRKPGKDKTDPAPKTDDSATDGPARPEGPTPEGPTSDGSSEEPRDDQD